MQSDGSARWIAGGVAAASACSRAVEHRPGTAAAGGFGMEPGLKHGSRGFQRIPEVRVLIPSGSVMNHYIFLFSVNSYYIHS